MISSSDYSTEQIRKHQIAEIAKALRAHLMWQADLGADGVSPPDEAELYALDAQIAEAQKQKLEKQRAALYGDPAEPPTEIPNRPDGPGEARPSPRPTSKKPKQEHGPKVKKQLANQGHNKIRRSTIRASQAPRQIHVMEGNRTLQQVREELGDCQRCILSKSRRALVFGSGSPTPEVLFIGDAPKIPEERADKALTGPPAALLGKMIKAMKCKDVYVCNIVKCRPPGSREPQPAEVAACAPFLRKQVLSLKPKVIVTLGRFAAQALLQQERASLSRMRGRWFEYEGIPVMPTYHPTYLLRNESSKRETWSDLKQVMARIGK